MTRVVLLDPTAPEELSFLQLHAPGLELVAPPPGERADALLRGAAAIVTRRTPATAEAMEQAGAGLKLIQLWSARSDKADVAAARTRGIAVAVMPQRGAIAVAECAMLLMLGLSKRVAEAHQATVAGAYRGKGVDPVQTGERLHKFQWMQLPGLFELHGKRLALVGFGEIASEVAKRARAFGMDVSYWSRTRAPAEVEAEFAISYKPFDDLLDWADIASLHVPHSPETDKLVGVEAFHRLGTSGFLINTCRGGVVDENALVAALHGGGIAGAGLDVYAWEPIPHDHPLLTCPNVLLLPHIGGGSGGARVKHAQDVLGNVVMALTGGTPAHVVSHPAWGT